MKTDRELLELAARAAGYDVRPHPNRKAIQRLQFVYQGNNWNPLTDDGDALRLAVTLRMDININDGECYAVTADSFYNGSGEDTLETTRRAIVRAAAAMGEAMQ